MVAVLPISSPATLRRCIYIINCKVAFLPVSALTNLRILYIYIQWRIQDFAQGGDKTGAKRPKNFLSPP